MDKEKNIEQFKRETGYKIDELSDVTGYTRQGLHYAFDMMDKGRMPSKKFLTCIQKAVEEKIAAEEKERLQAVEYHNKRIDRMRKLQGNIETFRGKAR